MARLAERFQKLSQKQKALLASLEKLDTAQLNKKPVPEKWSINQILYHILIAQEGTLKYIKYKVATRENVYKTGWKEALRTFVLKISLRLPFKYKAPATVSDVPDEQDFQEIKKRFEKNWEGFIRVIADFPKDLLDKNVFKHPVVGRISLAQTMVFLEEHYRHHVPQIEKLK